MGKHKHFRVAIDGEKKYSSGAHCRKCLDDWIQNHLGDPIYNAPFAIDKTQEDLNKMVLFLVTRQSNHQIRRLDGILFSEKVYTIEDGKEIQKYTTKYYPMRVYFDLRDPEQKEAYYNLEKKYTYENIIKYGVMS